MRDIDTSFDLSDFTPYLLAVSSERAGAGFCETYKFRYGMTRPEWRVLFHLGRHGAMTAKDIGDRAGIHKTKISRAVRALEEKQFLERHTLPNDRRSEMLSLCSLGATAFKDLTDEAARVEAELAARLGPDDAQKLKVLLRKLAILD